MSELENLYAKPEEWTNYGDMNPERHGGIFVKWERDMWHVIETRHYADLPKDLSENEHMFEHMWIEPMDIWVNGDPYKGFTERMLSGFDTFSNLPISVYNPDNAHKYMPEGESYEGYVEWYLNNEWESLIGYIVHHLRGYIDSDPLDFSSDYWGYLNNYGIVEQDF